jgi:hypothetical protein
MNTKEIQKAVAEAKRFIDAANIVLAERKESPTYFIGTKASGAARRASLDLTRQLAEMRKP